MHNLARLDVVLYPWNHHHNQDTELIYQSQVSSCVVSSLWPCLYKWLGQVLSSNISIHVLPSFQQYLSFDEVSAPPQDLGDNHPLSVGPTRPPCSRKPMSTSDETPAWPSGSRGCDLHVWPLFLPHHRQWDQRGSCLLPEVIPAHPRPSSNRNRDFCSHLTITTQTDYVVIEFSPPHGHFSKVTGNGNIRAGWESADGNNRRGAEFCWSTFAKQCILNSIQLYCSSYQIYAKLYLITDKPTLSVLPVRNSGSSIDTSVQWDTDKDYYVAVS